MRSPSRTANKHFSQAASTSSRNNISIGKLSALTLALGAALTVPDIWAQPVIVVPILWTAGDVSIGSNTLANIGAGNNGVTATVSAGQTLGLFTNDGTVWAQGSGFIAGSGQVIGTLINNGTISGNTNGDIVNQATIGTLINSGHVGTVGGGLPLNGVYNNGGTISVLDNTSTGTIFSWRTAINNDSGSTIATLNNSGVIYVQGSSGIGSAKGINNGGLIGTMTNSGVISGNTRSGAFSGYGIYNSGTIGTLSNQGWIGSNTSSSGVGLFNTVGGQITLLSNGSPGTIEGVMSGIRNGGSIATIVNAGRVSGNSFGIENTGNIGSLSNSGMIRGGYGLQNNAAATMTALNNSIGGTIYGSSLGVVNGNVIATLTNAGLIQGARIGVYNTYTSLGHSSNIGVLSNSGSIMGVTAAIYNLGTIGTLTNSSGGIITGAGYGIKNESGYIGLLSNAGTITSSSVGVSNIQSTGNSVLGTLGALSNSGLIYGGNTGVASNTGTLGNILNSGTISGGQYAISVGSGASLGGLANSGTIIGGIQDLDTNALTISGGSGSTFGTLTGNGGAVGSIVAASDLVFSSGNQLLNDGISVNSGNGTVTLAGGVLQVNNQIAINGNYHQNAGSTLAIGIGSSAGTLGVSADSGYGRLIVSGNATIDSGSSVVFKKLTTYNYAVGQRFVVVQAAGTGNYNAGNLIYTGTGYTASGSQVLETINSTVYSDLVVTITGVRNGSVATNGNANAVLNGLFNYAGLNQGLLDVYNPAIAISSPGDADKAGAQLSPAAMVNAVVGVSTAAFDAVQGAAAGRLDSVRTAQAGGSGIATGESSLDPALWGRIFGGQANQGERDGVSGYHANYGGFMLGGDLQVRPDWRVGALFNLAHTNVGNDGNNSGSSASVNSYGLTAYAGYDGHPWYLNLTAGVARQMYSTTRAVSFSGFSGMANGSFKGNLYTTSVEAGYPLAVGDATITPLAGVRYSTLKLDGYTETGGSGAALRVNGGSHGSLKSEIGAKYERSLKTRYGELIPFVRVGWNHEYRDTALTTNASFAADTSGSTAFTTQGASPLRNTAALSLGATLLQSKNLTLSARYTLEGAKGYTAQTGDLTLRWQY